MPNRLQDRKVAILATNGFEQSELEDPVRALRKEGATTEIVSPEKGKIRGWMHNQWGDTVNVDRPLSDAQASEYDALVLPGGVMNPDQLRMNESAVTFVKQFFEEGKPVAAICHGPWMLVEADVVRDRRLTSYPSIRTDVKNAGGEWVDEEVVVDQGLVTSRRPADLEAFNAKLIEEIQEGVHAGQMA